MTEKKRSKKIVLAAYYVTATLAILALLELGLAYLYKNPPTKTWVLRAVQDYYVNWEGLMVQRSSACSEYDPEFTYKLLPGKCEFTQREFATTISINSAGFRSSEESLVAPKIIALGDSHTMGWGVSDTENFVALLSRELGTPILNASVPSYGTERELRMLSKLDSSAAEKVLIQYCENDFGENQSFLSNGFNLPVMDQTNYERWASLHRSTRGYFFGKYLEKFFPILAKYSVASEVESDTSQEEADAFMAVLSHYGELLQGKELVVFEMNGFYKKDSKFIEALRRLLSSERYTSYADSIELVDLSPSLNVDHYYRYDDHLRPVGHKVVAKRLLEALM